jgi:peptide/nickel transport system permease protein
MSTGVLGNILPPADHAPVPLAEADRPRGFARQVFLDTFSNWRARGGAIWIVLLALAAVFAPFLASSHPYLLKANGHWSSPFLRHLSGVDVLLVIVALAAGALLPIRRFSFAQKAAMLLWIFAAALPLVSWNSIIHRGWAPGKEMLGPGFGYTLLTLIALVDLVILFWIPLRLEISATARMALGVIVFALAGLLIRFPVDPPETVVYEQHRNMLRDGQVEYALHAPIAYSPSDRLRDLPESRLTPPSFQHLLGTDVNNEDILSRMIHASRIALAIGFISTSIAVVIGVVIGGIMGFFVGKVDMFGMRLVEIFEAIPTLFLLITFVAFFGRNLYLMMAIIGLVSWTGDARFIRAEFLRLRNQDFVQAAIAAGLPLRSVLFRHMLPNGITPVLVAASFGIASAILAESTLSFLGLGLVDEPSWGQMLEQARSLGKFTWWIALFPGLAIFLTVFAYNLVGESFRDAIDPRIRKD